jgi:polar amino acid transport system substrate-binding protein
MAKCVMALLRFSAIVIAVLVLTGCSSPDHETPNVSTQPPLATPTRGTEAHDPALTPTVAPVSESALVDIREHGKLRVGILYNYPPFGYLASNGNVEGYEVELIRRIAERWEVEPEFVQVTRQTRLNMLLSGEIDILAAAMPHRRELEQYIEFSDTTFVSGYAVLVQSTSGIATLADIGNGPIVAVGHDAELALNEYATKMSTTITIQTVNEPADAVSLLTSGAVRAIAGRREQLILASSSVPDALILNELVVTEPYAFAVQRGDIPLRDILNLTLQEMASENVLGEVFSANFFGYPPDPAAVLPGDPAYNFESIPIVMPEHESTLDRCRRGEPIRVAGMNLTSEPALFDGQPVVDGYNRAVINEMARRWGVPVVEVPDSAGGSGINFLNSGQADLIVGLRPDISLIGSVAFSQSYYLRGLRLIHMSDVTIQGIADLEAKPSMALPPTDVSKDLIEDNNSIPHIETSESLTDAFEALTSRGVYALVGDEYALMLMSQAEPKIKVDERLYRPAAHVMAVSTYDPDFLTLINVTLQDMWVDGTLHQLQEQYFKPYVPTGQDVVLPQIEIWPGDASFLGFGQ